MRLALISTPQTVLDLAADLALAHAAGVEADDLLVQACQAALVLGYQVRFEGGLAIAGDLERQLPVLALDGLAGVTVTDVAAGGLSGALSRFQTPWAGGWGLLLAQVMRELGVQRSFQHCLGELLDEAVCEDLLGCAELQQEFIDDALVDAQGVTPVSGSVARIRSHTKNWTGPHEIPRVVEVVKRSPLPRPARLENSCVCPVQPVRVTPPTC